MILYRWAMRLYPRRSRLRGSREVEHAAESLVSEARLRGGRAGVAKAWLSLWIDVGRTLPLEWLAAARVAVRGETDETTAGTVIGQRTERKVDMDWVAKELAQAIRRLRRSPGFAVAVLLTLALGIGSAAAVFSVVNAVLLRPLPYPQADRLVALQGSRSGSEISISWLDLQDYRERNHMFESIAGYTSRVLTLTEGGPAERVRGQAVTPDLFSVLRVEPVLGRTFTAEEDRAGARVALIGHALWQRRFGGDAGILGRTVRMNSEPYTVVGVMPAGFDFPGGIVYGPAEVWLPIGLLSSEWTDRGSHPGLYAIGRLRAGTPFAAGRDDLLSIARDLEQEHPESNEKISVRPREALDAIVGSVRPALLTMLAGVALLLLIVCANVANLLIVRSATRREETSIRAALGASTGRLMAPALSESLLLSIVGALLGLGIAGWLIRSSASLLGPIPRVDRIALDARVLGFTGAITLLVVLLSGTLPALQAGWGRAPGMRRSRSGTRSAARIRSAMVVAQVGLSIVVLIAAGLVVKSFSRLLSIDPGVRPEGVLTFAVRLPEAEYDADRTRLFYDGLSERLRALPGVQSAGAISVLPFSGSGSQSSVGPMGSTREDQRRTDVNVVTPGYFQAMGVGLLAGRAFTPEDDASARPVVIIDEMLAANFWPGEPAVGQRLDGWGLHDAEVVGVAAHVRNYGVAADSRQELYMPHAQRPFNGMRVIIRTDGDPLDYVASIRSVLSDLDPSVPLDATARMQDVVSGTLAAPRLTAVLGAGFAGFAMLLAAVGIYGVMAYGVAQRRQEIGTRVALGAPVRRLGAHVVGGALRLAAAGVAVGLAVAFAATRLLESQIHGVSPTDPMTFTLLPLLLLGVAAFAAWLPARRAMRVSPMEALRTE